MWRILNRRALGKKFILIKLVIVALLFGSSLAAQQHNHNHSGHNHDHSGHNHSGHNHDHSGHDHSGHNHDHSGHDHSGHNHGSHDHDSHGHHGPVCGVAHDHTFDAGNTALHHISDANVFSIGPLQIPLPCFLYAPGTGWDIFMSSKLKFDKIGHGDGGKAYNRYVLDGGAVRRVKDASFPMGDVAISGIVHQNDAYFVCHNNKLYETEAKSSADGGLFGGGITSFYDFSLTKNVTSMLIVTLLLSWLFLRVARRYRERDGMAPKGTQSFIETMFVFIQDEVAKPFLGAQYMKFLPFLMAIFFFILGLNLFGQIPFFGGSNVTGNLGVTMVLGILAFLVTNFNGNKHYWEHILWMPGVPAWVKTILTPVEILGIFIKPLTLMLRLFANITAGHMVIIIFVSLIFIFGDLGNNMGAGFGTAIASTLLTLFMMAIELLVAFIQAFAFCILTASYIGAAVEESHEPH